MADQLKAEGNKAFIAKDFDKAIDLFSQAIEIDPQNHVLYSNRSGAYASKKDFTNALKDAKKVTEIKSDWPKGWSRVAAAFHGLADYEHAVEAYEKILELDPNNAQAKSGLAQCQEQLNAGGDAGGMGQIFNDPGMFAKLAGNPTTAAYLADPTFMAQLNRLKQNPNNVNEALKDPRMMQVIGVLLGLNLQMGNPADAANAAAGQDTEMSDAPPKFTPVEVPEEGKKQQQKEATPEPEVDDEAKAKKEAKQKADAEKALGTENYKKRNFDTAIEHYSKAWELHKDITYLNNLAAAKFEKGDYDGCIEECKKAIEEGREMRADFKLIAKAFGRIGTAYQKQGDLAQAVEYYQRSLTEHRTPEILSKLRAAEKAKIEAEKQAYIDPAKAEEAREIGNKHFKEANWVEAVKSYTEMIKRNPEDPRGYSNLAAALTKLGSLPEAIKACDDAIKRDPHFLRAHIRKAQAFILMKEFNKALDALNEASAQDQDGKGAHEIEKLTREVLEKQYSAREGETEEETMARVQRDPEIASIIQDPVMQSILQQARANPQALNDHMKNPIIRTKIQKLMAAGIIRVG